MISIFHLINTIFGTREFLLIVHCLSFLFKFILLWQLLCRFMDKESPKNLLVSFIFVIVGSMIQADLRWIPVRLYATWMPSLDFRLVALFGRIGWAFYIIQNLALVIFLESLIFKKLRLNIWHICFFSCNAALLCTEFYLAFAHFNIPAPTGNALTFEVKIIQCVVICSLVMLTPVIFKVIKELQSNMMPKILACQTKTFLYYLLLPHLIFDSIVTTQLFNTPLHYLPINRFAIIGLSTLLIFYALYYCCKRLIGLHFLDAQKHVGTHERVSFTNIFHDILEQLSYSTSVSEIAQVTRLFFNTAFDIPLSHTQIHILYDENSYKKEARRHSMDNGQIVLQVDHYLVDPTNNNSKQAAQILKTSRIFIRDEICFRNFYAVDESRTHILNFLDTINADIFIPIYKQHEFSGYIIIKRDARTHRLYSDDERDKMLIYNSYLSNIVNILRQNNLDDLLRRQKELHEELYHKHQEVNQYKESIRSFFKKGSEREVGIVYYKSCNFRFANQAAADLVTIDLNRHLGDPLAGAFSSVAVAVQKYRTPQQVTARTAEGNNLVLNAVPSSDSNGVMILVYRPEISDLMSRKMQLLKDPSKWDYLLYLETTQAGQLINKLIPGSSETILSFKIGLLQSALSRKATLLQLPDDDLKPTVELLHHISLRQKLHFLTLQSQEHGNEIALKIFGIHPLYGGSKQSEGLLELLDGTGTLFIQNIHYLSLETQEMLAAFIAYGFTRRIRSSQRKFADVRIICSSTQQLELLVSEGQFYQKLYNELQKMSLSLPALATLNREEITTLADEFCADTLAGSSVQNLLDLNERDKARLLKQQPLSMSELKTKVLQLIAEKSQKHNIPDNITYDHQLDIADPEIAEAVRMGRKALRDRNSMTLLWHSFNKNQTVIAQLLGVHRSTVQRRCVMYGLK